MTIFEVLQNAQSNLNKNERIGMMLAKEQLNNAMKLLESGKGLYDKFEFEEEV